MLNEFISFLRDTCKRDDVLVKKDGKLTVVSFKDTLHRVDMNIAVVFQEPHGQIAIQIRRPIGHLPCISDYEAANCASACYKDIKVYFTDSILHCVSYIIPKNLADLKKALSVLMTVMVSVSDKIK